ncbi:MAG: exopolysaccharide transport family protein, partial [Flavisolibacter sp.]
EKKKSKTYTSINLDTAKRILKDKIVKFDILSSNDNQEYNVIELLKLYEYDYFNIIKYLYVNRVEGTDYLDVVFRSENPELSATVVNTLGEDFINYYKSLTQQRGEQSAEVIREMVNTQQRKVDSLNQLLYSEKVRQGTVDPVSRSTSAMETVKELETQLGEAKASYFTYTQRLNYLKQRKADLMSGSVSGTNDEVLHLRERRKELTDKGSNDPQIKKQIDDLTTQIVAKSSNAVNAQKNSDEIQTVNDKINEADANAKSSSLTIADLQNKINQYTKLTNQNPGSGVTVSAIQAQLDIENKALGNIKEKLTQAVGLVKENPAENIKQTLVGQPAVEPEPAKKLFIMGLSGVSTFCAASIIVLFLAIFDPSIKSPSLFSKAIRKAPLASVVHVHMKEGHAADIILEENAKTDKIVDLFKQNLRKLRYEIEHSGKKIFLFTSAKQKEGKSTIIQALAGTLLLSGKKVLIVDTNFTHNSLTKYFNAESKLEHSEIDGHLGNDALQKYISHTQYKNLDIIGCEGGNYTPSEVLKKGNILERIHELTNYYDYILMEGASLNDHSDSWELSKYAESVSIVFSANTAIGSSDSQAFNYMETMKQKFLGAVLNDVRPENIDA